MANNSDHTNKDTAWKRRGIIRILILVCIAIAVLLFLNEVRMEIDRMLLAEKTIEKQFQLDLIANQADRFVDKSDDWANDYDHYLETFLASIEMLDQAHMTYAALFDENLQNLSARSPSYEGSPFEPTVFPEFVEAVKTNKSGELILPFTPPGAEERDMNVLFRWMPSNDNLENRVLGVVAISRFSVNTQISNWILIMSICLVVVVLVVAIIIWRKQMTDSLNRTLEETVKYRTEQLETQTAAAQKASVAKSDFLSNMSHEMRTPMNAIIGMTAIAKHSDELERKNYCLTRIEDASTHLLSVINDILDMSKIEANKFELSIEKFNFERVLQKVANVIVFRVDEKQQNFTVHIDQNIPSDLLGDDQRITQVITNLISNAVKFTPECGSIRLNADLLEEEDGICTIKVEVIDTGIGISPEQQSKLFNSFVQAENSTTRKYGGTGLGLAISKHIVEMMDGKIWVESEQGKGSTFAFTFKAEKVVDNNDSLAEMGLSWKDMRMLVVDDSLDTRDYFVDIMHRFGSGCDVAASGEEACQLIEDHGPYNLYFVDWRMPGMDGIELARKINAIDGNKSVIIMISAKEWDDVEDEAKQAGISKFLAKPLFPSNIADCINECLGSISAIQGNNEINYRGIFNGHRVILAEDVEVNREIVLSLLEPTKLVIDVAENGQEAYEIFKANPDVYDMILMDVQMPVMDGYSATKLIRALDFQKAKEIPIVAMTANVFREDIEKCLECGMNDHLGKPLDYEKMITKLFCYLLK
jgi:Signal transduction histidine kinase